MNNDYQLNRMATYLAIRVLWNLSNNRKGNTAIPAISLWEFSRVLMGNDLSTLRVGVTRHELMLSFSVPQQTETGVLLKRNPLDKIIRTQDAVCKYLGDGALDEHTNFRSDCFVVAGNLQLQYSRPLDWELCHNNLKYELKLVEHFHKFLSALMMRHVEFDGKQGWLHPNHFLLDHPDDFMVALAVLEHLDHRSHPHDLSDPGWLILTRGDRMVVDWTEQSEKICVLFSNAKVSRFSRHLDNVELIIRPNTP